MNKRFNKMKNFIGIDVSKDTFHYCVVDHQGLEVAHGNLTMDKAGFDSLKQIISKHTDNAVAMESTGGYHTNILSFILSFKQEVCLVNPLLIKRFTQTMTLRKTKTDKADAKIIAQFACQNIEHLSYFQLTDCDEITALARAREDLSKQVAKAKTQLKQQVNIAFPELLSEFNIFTDTTLQVLLKLPTTEVIRNTKIKAIEKIISSVSARGRRSNLTADRLKALAEQSIGKSSAQMQNLMEV